MLLSVTLLSLLMGCQRIDVSRFNEADIIFQSSTSSQSTAIQLATHSKYSHMGIIVRNGDEISILEAVQPVKFTPLSKWIARGEGRHFVLKRLKDSVTLLTVQATQKLKMAEQSYIGKPYDPYFEWSDDRIYCSELVWKVYKQALGIEIGTLQPGSDFDFSSPAVKEVLKKRFPGGFPSDEKVISPARIFESGLLETVYEN